MTRRSDHGFTFLELLLVVAVIAVLVAIALPSWQSSAVHARRIDAVLALATAASNLERYQREHGSYKGATLGPDGIAPALSTHGHYRLQLILDRAAGLPPGASYRIEATPVGAQADDTECGTYSLDETGFKTAANGASERALLSRCWAGS